MRKSGKTPSQYQDESEPGRLLTSTEGSFSARLDGTSFLITPYGIDRQAVDLPDLVLIRDGQREAGKQPSRGDQSACICMQAMSCGQVVIGCRGQGIAEIIQHGTNGFLVGPGNEKELTLAMGMLLREPQRRRNLGAAARLGGSPPRPRR